MAVRPQSLRFGVAPSPYTPLSGQHRAGFAWHDSLPGWRSLRSRDLAPRVPPSLITVVRGTGILTRCPSPTALALGLGPPHPQLISMAAEPLGIRWGGFAPPSRYSCRHSHSPPLHLGSRLGFSADGDAPLPWLAPSAASVTGLSPGGLSAPRHSRPVSYYALFQGWLLLSQPPGCLRAATTLPTEPVVRDLSRRSGLFPSRRRIFAPAVSHPPPAWSSNARPDSAAFVVWFGSVSGKPPRRSSAIPPRRPTGGLHLNAFRGEPAISGFAWHFTATRSSSGPFATDLGSALHRRVPPASAWPRVDHPVSGRSQTTPRPFGLAFAPAPPVPGLASPPGLTRRLILQKARRHRMTSAPTGRKRMVSGSLSLPSPGCFSPFPHGTGALSVVGGM